MQVPPPCHRVWTRTEETWAPPAAVTHQPRDSRQVFAPLRASVSSPVNTLVLQIKVLQLRLRADECSHYMCPASAVPTLALWARLSPRAARGREGTSATLSGPLLGFELCPPSPCRQKLRECFSLNNSSLLCNPSVYRLPDKEEPGVKLTSPPLDARRREGPEAGAHRPSSRTARLRWVFTRGPGEFTNRGCLRMQP